MVGTQRADCWDNVPMKSFFASLKKELVHGADFATRAEAFCHPRAVNGYAPRGAPTVASPAGPGTDPARPPGPSRYRSRPRRPPRGEGRLRGGRGLRRLGPG